MDQDKIDLNLDVTKIRNHKDYLQLWKQIGRIKITCVEKNESCKHKEQDSFIFKNPYDKPEGLCHALLHVLELYIWRTALGFPSWNNKNRKIFKIHCPDSKGTVWEMEKID